MGIYRRPMFLWSYAWSHYSPPHGTHLVFSIKVAALQESAELSWSEENGWHSNNQAFFTAVAKGRRCYLLMPSFCTWSHFHLLLKLPCCLKRRLMSPQVIAWPQRDFKPIVFNSGPVLLFLAIVWAISATPLLFYSCELAFHVWFRSSLTFVKGNTTVMALRDTSAKVTEMKNLFSCLLLVRNLCFEQVLTDCLQNCVVPGWSENTVICLWMCWFPRFDFLIKTKKASPIVFVETFQFFKTNFWSVHSIRNLLLFVI